MPNAQVDHSSIESSAAQPPPTGPSRKNSLRGLAILTLLLFAVLGYFILSGIHARATEEHKLAAQTNQSATPVVSATHPKSEQTGEEIILPGNMQAFSETPVWARASGYLRRWTVDIGAHVTRGQLLAEIEAPEVDHQLQQAREELLTNQENLKLAQITADRYQGLLKEDSIAKQDVDTAVQNQAARSATVRSSEANVARLQQLVGFEKVYAPFNGVITARNIDIGALIDAGSNTPGKELFRIAAIQTLRVYINVPEVYERAAVPNAIAYLTLNEFPGRQFQGRIVRNANAIDPASRTLLVEVDVPNKTGELLPGSYVSMHLKLPAGQAGRAVSVNVPANALLFRAEGLQVATVKSGHVVLMPVAIGRDYGDTVEITHGLSPADLVIINPSDSIANGEAVQVGGSAEASR